MSLKLQLTHRLNQSPDKTVLRDIGISIYNEVHFVNEITHQDQTRYEPNEKQNKRLYKIVRQLTGKDQVIVTPFGELNFESKYYSHGFFNVVAKNRPNTGVERMTYDYKTRICVCGFFDNKPFKHDEKDFYTIPAILDLSKTDVALKKDIKEFLERSPYA
jgi:hypothetical protein